MAIGRHVGAATMWRGGRPTNYSPLRHFGGSHSLNTIRLGKPGEGDKVSIQNVVVLGSVNSNASEPTFVSRSTRVSKSRHDCTGRFNVFSLLRSVRASRGVIGSGTS